MVNPKKIQDKKPKKKEDKIKYSFKIFAIKFCDVTEQIICFQEDFLHMLYLIGNLIKKKYLTNFT